MTDNSRDTHINVKSWHLVITLVTLILGAALTTGGAYSDIKDNKERIGALEQTMGNIRVTVAEIKADTGNTNRNVEELMSVFRRQSPEE